MLPCRKQQSPVRPVRGLRTLVARARFKALAACGGILRGEAV